MTLLERLRALRPGASNRTLRLLLDHGLVHVDGAPAKKAAAPVADRAKITIQSKPRAGVEAIPTVPIVFEDSHVVVIDKPSNLRTVTPRGAKTEESAWSRLRKMLRARDRDSEVFLIHRLDRAASGLLVFAKSEKVKVSLKAALAKRDMERRYVAIVKGKPEQQEGEFRSGLLEDADPLHRVRSVKPRDPPGLRKVAREAVTRYRVLGEEKGLAAVEIRLETGRKHQIRVHFAEAGHPLLGDRLYDGPPADRLFLHAYTLGFAHPVTKAPMSFNSSIPEEFRSRLRKAFRAVEAQPRKG